METVTARLQRKYKKAADALATLRMAIDDMKNVDRIAQDANEYRDRLYKTFRDSLVQRFEYSFDLTWKYLGEYLAASGRQIEIKTPKAIFREAFQAQYFSEDEVRQALSMVDHRNLTTHGYDEQLIEFICAYIPQYYALLENILQKASSANA